MGAAAIESLNPSVPLAFGLNVRGTGRGKSSFVCDTDKGMKIIRKSRFTAEKLILAHRVKEKLFEAGFGFTDRFILTDSGAPYAGHNGDLYVAYDFFDAREARFDNHTEFTDALKTVARLHSLTNNPSFFEGLGGALKSENAAVSKDALLKQLDEIKGYKKALLKQSKFSDFDVLFLKSFALYEKSVTGAAALASDAESASGTCGPMFAHNALKEETILFAGENVYITGFGECSGDSFLFDLASMIKRHARASKNPMPPGCILDAYGSENPLSKESLQTLHALLLVPDKFYKTCTRYYSKKRTWTPVSLAGLMNELSAGWEAYEHYITDYFENV